MKQNDFVLIFAIVVVAIVSSLLLSNFLIAPPKNRQTKVEFVEQISDSFPLPDGKYFNNESINPTRLIKIGEGPNPNPFAAGN